MKSEKKVDKSQVELTITLDEGEWQKCIQESAHKLSQGVNVPGFRPGKAPADVVINTVGETRVVSEAAESAINKFYLMALKEQQVAPIAPPKIAVEKVELKTPLVFKAEVMTMPEVELGDYQKIKVEVRPITVESERVEGVLRNIQRQQAQFNPVEREIKTGDWAEIDFDGKIDGKTFSGGASKNHPLIVGDGVFLPDFETALVGMKTGETKTFILTFPVDYHQAELAQRQAEFTVTVHKVKAVVMPEINDELATKSGDFKDLAALKTDIEKFLKEDIEKQELDRQKEAAINQLINLTKVELPEMLIEQEVDAMWHDFEHQLEHQNLKVEDYLKKTEMTAEKLRAEWQEPARKRVIAGLALNAFRQKEGIEATDADVAAEIARLKSVYPDEKDEVEQKYKHDWERSRLKTLLSGQMAIDKLWNMATNQK